MKSRSDYSIRKPLHAKRVESHFRLPLLKSIYKQLTPSLEEQVASTVNRMLTPNSDGLLALEKHEFELYSLDHMAVYWLPTSFTKREIWIEFGSRVRGVYTAEAIGLIASYYTLLSMAALAPEESDHLIYNARMIRIFLEQQPNAMELLKAID